MTRGRAFQAGITNSKAVREDVIGVFEGGECYRKGGQKHKKGSVFLRL